MSLSYWPSAQKEDKNKYFYRLILQQFHYRSKHINENKERTWQLCEWRLVDAMSVSSTSSCISICIIKNIVKSIYSKQQPSCTKYLLCKEYTYKAHILIPYSATNFLMALGQDDWQTKYFFSFEKIFLL